MDTGMINSNKVLGMNAKPKDSLHDRRVVTCSPISSKTFASIQPADNILDGTLYPPGTVFQVYSYGPIGQLTNYTFSYATDANAFVSGYDLT